MGSSVHDLVGDAMITRRTSSSEQRSSSVSVELTAGCEGAGGGGQCAVLALTKACTSVFAVSDVSDDLTVRGTALTDCSTSSRMT